MAIVSPFSAIRDKLIFRPEEINIDKDDLKIIYKADQFYINDLVGDIISLAEKKRSHIEAIRRSSTKRKVLANIQNIAVRTQEFIQVFSGVIEIVKGVDSRAGPIAYGTFALLLTIAKNKQVREDVITGTLENLCRWLSRLKTVESLEQYNKKILDCIFEIYIRIIEFARIAIRYYQSSSSRRVLEAVTRPPQLFSEKHAEVVKSLIADLMEELVIIQYRRIKEITLHLDESKRESHEERIEMIERSFGVSSNLCAEIMIEESRRRFDGMFCKGKPKAGAVRKAPQLEEISLDYLSRSSSYKSWLANKSSCMFLLEGENYDEYDPSIRLCWLSPAAVQFFQWIKELGKDDAVFHFVDGSAKLESETTMMLKSIVMQLLRRDHKVCKKRFREIQNLYITRTEEQAEQRLDILFEILKIVIRSYDTEKTIYIILVGIENLYDKAPREIFGSFLSLIHSLELLITVKIFVVCRSGYWPNVSPRDESGLQRALALGGHEERLKMVFAELGWKQKTLDTRNK